ncbi:MAG: hypothetical protein DCC71_11905 [Proteobacteria bacterium]|nr:MAG: hypothetical protein DCC71_11905 [Pseudomonadota bacterium]
MPTLRQLALSPLASIAGCAALALALTATPSSSQAASLLYRIANTSVVTGSVAVDGVIDMEPDLADAFPTSLIATGSTNTRPRGTIRADVPLADPTGNPITFESGTITFPALGRAIGGGIATLPFPPLPGLPVGGTTVFAVVFDLGDLSFVIEPPFTTTALFRTGENEWSFAALATGTISGTVSPELLIPTVDPVVLGPVPIEPTAVTLPIVGTFSGGPTGTRITIGLDDSVEPATMDLVVESLEFVLLPGLVEFHATLDTLSLADADLSIEATNSTPLSGSPAPACGLGAELAMLGLLTRRFERAVRGSVSRG